jgi:ubiquinone/menaquinone biosynthesis C-methylase UbiE
MFWKIFEKIYSKTWIKRVAKECKPFIEPKSTLLDIGCGHGLFTKGLQKEFDLKVLGADIKDQRKVDIPFLLTDGKSLPLKDESFDFVLIAFVLHHIKEAELVLKEAKRVARKKIIIYEDIKEGVWGNLVCFFHALFWSILNKMPFTFNFKSQKGWEEIFRKLNLKLVFAKKTFSFPIKRMLFVLSVK